ncbi:Beta-glucosidase 42 [Bienertia sinuspersici]
MCSNFWPCTDHPMDHGLNGHCLKGLCPGDRRPPPPPPHKVHLAPMG